jgi:hypothetical protein
LDSDPLHAATAAMLTIAMHQRSRAFFTICRVWGEFGNGRERVPLRLPGEHPATYATSDANARSGCPGKPGTSRWHAL